MARCAFIYLSQGIAIKSPTSFFTKNDVMLLTQSRSVGHHWRGGVGVDAVRVGNLGGGGGHGQAHQPAQEQLARGKH